MQKNRCVFLDRDGVLIPDRGYVYQPEGVSLLSGVSEALKILKKEQDFLLIVITNQSGVGRGYFQHYDVYCMHRVIQSLLQAAGSVSLDAFYYCPHRPHGGCLCRKPSPYLLFKAERDFSIDLARSFFVGDRASDLECARRAGVKGIEAPLVNAITKIIKN